MRYETFGRCGLLAIAALLGPWMVPAVSHSADIVVSSATPSSAEQGTVGLLVTIKGSGFPKKPQVRFCRTDTGTGTCDPDRITVTSAAGKGTTTIEATIDIALDASATNFDIEVIEPLSGRKGRGTGLFAVLKSTSLRGSEQAFGSFSPDIAFSTRLNAGDGARDARVLMIDGSVWALMPDVPAKGICDWSPDGSWIMYAHEYQVRRKGGWTTRHEIRARRSDGSGVPQLLLGTEYTNSADFCASYVRWTPTLVNGRQYLIYQGPNQNGSDELFARSISCTSNACSTGVSRQITSASRDLKVDFDISADGTRLVAWAFPSANRDEQGRSYAAFDLYTIALDAAGEPVLTDLQDIAAPYYLRGRVYREPRFSNAMPGKVVFMSAPGATSTDTNAYLESISYDSGNRPIAHTVIYRFPEPVTIPSWDIDDAGNILCVMGSLQVIQNGGLRIPVISTGGTLDIWKPIWRPHGH